MGLEVAATLRRGRTRIPGRAQLEGDILRFRSDGVRATVKLSTVSAVQAAGDRLTVVHAAGTLELTLASGTADRWASRIRSPKSRLDKLGVKEGMTVAVVGVDDAAFHGELRTRGAIVADPAPDGCALIFFGAESASDLVRLGELRRRLSPAGAVWVVHRKGKGATLKDVEVFAAAKAAGLVDNKVASFSETHTAERLVIPLAQRPAR